MHFSRISLTTGLFACSILTGIAAPPTEWTPPKTSLPPEFVAATATAFNNGLTDPRAGEFREVDIVRPDPQTQKPVVHKAAGWVLPAEPGRKPTVVCWNGLDYEPSAIGPKEDLAAFVKGAKPTGMPMVDSARSELWEAASPQSALGVAILLRVGRVDLAESVAASLRLAAYKSGPSLSGDVLWYRRNRAIEAHERGDDQLVITDAEWLLKHQAVFDEMAVVKGYPPMQSLNVFDPAALLNDARSRIQRGPRPPIDLAKVKTLPIEEQVRQIVAHLDEMKPTAAMYPGGLFWDSDPIYRAALRVGAPIVDALLDCAEKDRRLTLAVACGRPWWRDHVVVSVRSMAQRMAEQLIGIGFAQFAPADRCVKEMREVWEATKNGTLLDRCSKILQDDKATPDEWLRAAGKLIEPAAERKEGQRYVAKPGEVPPPMRGEPLRTRTSPSVTDLMIKRALDIMPKGRWPSSDSQWDTDKAIYMAEGIVAWDPATAITALKKLFDRVAESAAALDQYSSSQFGEATYDDLGILTRMRMKLGDKTAATDYEPWVQKSKPSVGGFTTFDSLKPLYGDPAWGEPLAKKLFIGDDAPWNPDGPLRKGNTMNLDRLVTSKLLVLAPIRESLVAVLRDKTVAGEVWREPNDYMRVGMNGATGGRSYSPRAPDTRAAGVGVKLPYRVCDMVADAMSGFQRIPECRSYWSIKDRDVAIEALIAYIQKAGASLADLRPRFPRWGDD